jgi:hypothetical protein
MTETQRAYCTDLDTVTFGNTNATLVDLEKPTVAWVGKTLNLGSKVTLKFVLNINGYSGNAPAGFTALDPCSPDYRNAVADWVQKHGLTGVYSYDISVKKWNKEDFFR